MLIDKYKKYFLNIEDIYFASEFRESKSDITRFIQYNDVVKNSKKFKTNTINLKYNIDDIQKEFRKSIKSEINQAIKNHNVSVDIFFRPDKVAIENFCNFYNKVAKEKGLPCANRNKIERLFRNILISKAIYQNNDLVWHLYIFDDNRMRLLYSSSLQTQDNELFKIVSRANKLLHFEDIKFAKLNQFNIFDFGGISLVDNKVAGIDQFKLGFSKEIEIFCHFNVGNTVLGKIILFLYSLLEGLK